MHPGRSKGVLALGVILAVQSLGAMGYAKGAATPAEPVYSLQNRFGISVLFEAKTGQYWVSYQGQPWFGAGNVSVLLDRHWYRSAGTAPPEAALFEPPQGSLALEDIQSTSGHDRLGAFNSLRLSWKVPATDLRLVTAFRLYRDAPCLVFGQEFPGGFKKYASGDWTVPSVAFPHFLGSGMRSDLYSWVSEGMGAHRFGYGSAFSLDKTVDLLLLSDQDYNTIILSPLAHYLVATQQSAKSQINCGIEGLVEEIPAGFKHEHIMVVGRGIGETFRQWGQALLDKAGKKIPSKYEGDTLKYPVYWDDYGAYYREHGFKEAGCKTYEDIILGVAQHAKEHGLRIGAYEQDGDQMRIYQEGLFEPRADLYPHGFKWLHEQLGAPLEAYVCWMAAGGPYRKKYPYFDTPKGKVTWSSMGDVFYSLDYWRDIAQRLASWGVILLQQDFESVYEGNAVMMAGVDRMDRYFKNQAKAMQEKGIKMQYCMQLPRNVMESTENPAIISLQGSWDHHVPKPEHRGSGAPGAELTNWFEASDEKPSADPFVWGHLMFTSAFYGAVGLWPSRDTMQTMADPNAFEDVLLANLLGGEIQLGHRIGECNFALLKHTYRESDGLILKADRPIVPLDRCYHERCGVGYTESDRDGQRWFYVLSLPAAGYLESFRVADLGVGGRWVVYNYDTGVASVVDATNPLKLTREARHEYFVVAPILANGMAVIGDATKFVSMADMRIASVAVEGNSLRVGVVGSETDSPIVTGYAKEQPTAVEQGSSRLQEMSSLDRLRVTKSGWYWDSQTKLWYVKPGFAGAARAEIRFYTID